NYTEIQLCISVAPVMANFSTVISNPGSFINVITCACTDPFKTTFPECVDCFENTDQEDVLNMSDLDAVIEGINKVCALESAIFGVGSGSSSTTTSDASTTSTASTPTTSSNGSTRDSGLLSGALFSMLFGATIMTFGNVMW
ncbi:hypothetical protein B0H10DRAFT_1782192, partial [Mycena sp. CBHHK59/15]